MHPEIPFFTTPCVNVVMQLSSAHWNVIEFLGVVSGLSTSKEEPHLTLAMSPSHGP